MPLTLTKNKNRQIPIRSSSHISGVKPKPKPRSAPAMNVSRVPAMDSSDDDDGPLTARSGYTDQTGFSAAPTQDDAFAPKDYNFGNPVKQIDSSDDEDAMSVGGGSDVTQSAYGEAANDSNEQKQKKNDLLIKLYQMQEKGVQLSRDFTMDDSLTDIEFEYNKLTSNKKMKSSTELMKQGLMFTVNTLEFLNNKYDPFDIDLEGWGSHETANIHKYDDVFEELYDKYKDNVSAAPEVKFLMMFIGSAMAFHWSKQYIKDVHTSNSQNIAERRNNVAAMLGNQTAPPPSQPAAPQYNPDPMADNTNFEMPPPPITMADLKGHLNPSQYDPGSMAPPTMTTSWPGAQASLTGNSVPPLPIPVSNPEPQASMPALTKDDVSVSGSEISEHISIPSTTTRRRKKPVTKKFTL